MLQMGFVTGKIIMLNVNMMEEIAAMAKNQVTFMIFRCQKCPQIQNFQVFVADLNVNANLANLRLRVRFTNFCENIKESA